MASFTPLEDTSAGAGALSPAVLRRTGRGNINPNSGRPVGIVIDKSCRVYITQIPVERIERDGASALRAEFEAYGPLDSYKMFTERSGRFIGSALCTYRNPADAANAIAGMDGKEVESSVVKAAVARDHGVMLLHQERTRPAAGEGGGILGDGGRHYQSFLPAHLGTGEGGGVGGRGGGVAGGDGRWHHDRYALIAEGKDMDEVLGIRRREYGADGNLVFGGRGGRGFGRGGRGGRGRGGVDRVDAAFERYINDRDGRTGLDDAYDKYIAERDSLIENKDSENPQQQQQQQQQDDGQDEEGFQHRQQQFGRGGRGGGVERVDAAFERYINDRDGRTGLDDAFEKYIAERNALLQSKESPQEQRQQLASRDAGGEESSQSQHQPLPSGGGTAESPDQPQMIHAPAALF